MHSNKSHIGVITDPFNDSLVGTAILAQLIDFLRPIFGEIYIITGNYDLALDKIEYLLSIPSWLSKGDLQINPIYDNLRGLKRFQKIIDSRK